MEWSQTRRAGALLMAAVVAVLPLVLSPAPAGAHSPHDHIIDVEVSPDFARDGTAYTISRSYLLQSTDGGSTWHRLVRGLDNSGQFTAIGISQQDPEVVYVSSRSDGVYKSTDAGGSWARVNEGFGRDRRIASLVVSPHSDDVVLALGERPRRALFRTDDGGASWEAVGSNGATSAAFAPDDPEVLLVGHEDGRVTRSGDLGETWRDAAFDQPDAGSVRAVALSPTWTDDRTWFVGTESGGVFATDDDGRSFAARNTGLADRRVQALLVSPGFARDSTIWVVAWGDVFESKDAGATWSSVGEGVTRSDMADRLEVPHLTRIRLASPAGADAEPTLLLAGFDGLFRSRDFGRLVWEPIETQVASNIAAIAVSPAFADDGTIVVATYLNGAFRSEDRGETWTAINVGLSTMNEWIRRPDYIARLLSIGFFPSYADDSRLYAGLRGRLLTSSDRGQRWESQTPPGLLVEGENPPDYMLVTFSPAFDQDGTVVLGTDGGKVFRSTDGGTGFRLVSETGREFYSIVAAPTFPSDGTIFAGTPEGLFGSDDAGDTWTRRAPFEYRVTSLAVSPGFADDGTIFVGTPNGLQVTTDAARTWSAVDDAPFAARGDIESVALSPAFAEDGTVLVSVRGEGLFTSTDGGATFRETAPGLLDENIVLSNFYHSTSEPIVFSPGFATDRTVFGIAEDRLLRSTDGGASWARLDLPVTTHDTDPAAAPSDLLRTPVWEPGVDDGTVDVDRAEDDADRSFSTPIGALSLRRIGAALLAAALALGVVWGLQRTGRVPGHPWAVRFGVAGAVLVVALLVLAA